MKKVFDLIRDHYRRRSRFALVFDILFYTFILLLIIPPTRRMILPPLIRLTTVQAREKQPGTATILQPEDYSWQVMSPDGKMVSLNDHRDKVIFLNFWATWCPPCIAEMPSIETLYRDYGDRIAFILVTHEEIAVVKAFLEKQDLDLPVYIQRYAAPGIFSTGAIPATFIISREGRVVLEKKGAAKWDGIKTRRLLEKLSGEA